MGAIADYRNRKISQVNVNKSADIPCMEAPTDVGPAMSILATLFGVNVECAIDTAQAFIDSGARVIGIDPALKGSEKTVISEVSNGVIDVIAECDIDELTHAASLASDSATDIADASYEVSNSAADIADATAEISAAADEIKEVISEVKKSPEVPLSSPSKSEMKPEKSLNK